jgi:hypothetical protein
MTDLDGGGADQHLESSGVKSHGFWDAKLERERNGKKSASYCRLKWVWSGLQNRRSDAGAIQQMKVEHKIINMAMAENDSGRWKNVICCSGKWCDSENEMLFHKRGFQQLIKFNKSKRNEWLVRMWEYWDWTLENRRQISVDLLFSDSSQRVRCFTWVEHPTDDQSPAYFIWLCV